MQKPRHWEQEQWEFTGHIDAVFGAPMASKLPEASWGEATVRRFYVDEKRAYVEYYARNELWLPGWHTQLDIGGTGWMFDSYHEKCMNLEAVENARGDVLIGGLGIGLILWPILAKPEVASVTVIDNSPDVATIVMPSLAKAPGYEKLTLELADARTWGSGGRLFDYCWMDVVPSYGYSHSMLSLQSRWIDWARPFLKPGGDVGHWGYRENLCWLLHQASDYADWPEADKRPWPQGPPDPIAATLIHDKHPHLAKKLGLFQMTADDLAAYLP